MKNKKAVSDMVSYVLLIVIALSIASGVYAWLKFYVPSAQESQKCTEEVAMAVNDYSCSQEIITMTVENKGYFNINGFFMRATNDSSKIPINMLPVVDAWAGMANVTGRYDFREPFKNAQTVDVKFDYDQLGSVQRVQLQPFLVGKKGELLICPRVVDLNIEGC